MHNPDSMFIFVANFHAGSHNIYGNSMQKELFILGGIAKIMRAGISVKDCSFCLRYNICTLINQKTNTDTKKEVQKIIRINQVTDNKIDKVTYAFGCIQYLPNNLFVSRILNYYTNLPN